MSQKDLIEKAYEAKLARNYALAKSLFEKCLEQYPESAEAMRELGLVFYGGVDKSGEGRNYHKAKELVLKSLEINDSFWGHLYLAMILNSLAEPLVAEIEFKKALENAPSQDGRQIVGRYYADFLVARNRHKEAKEQATFALPFFVNEAKDRDRLNHLIEHCEFKLANQ